MFPKVLGMFELPILHMFHYGPERCIYSKMSNRCVVVALDYLQHMFTQNKLFLPFASFFDRLTTLHDRFVFSFL